MNPTLTYDWGRASAAFGLDEPGCTRVRSGHDYDFTINDGDSLVLLLDTINALYGHKALGN